MAEFTAEQQAAIDAEVARLISIFETSNTANVELARREHELIMENRRIKLESVRIARETLTENYRVKPVDERELDANTILQFSETLSNYII